MNEQDKTTHISIALDSREAELLALGKEKSGIKGSADFIRHVIMQYARAD